MDGAVHAAAAQQCRVRRIDDGVHGLRRDVPLNRFNPRHVRAI